MPGLKRRSSSKGRKPLLDSLVDGQVRRTTPKSRVDFIYIDQNIGFPGKMESSKKTDDMPFNPKNVQSVDDMNSNQCSQEVNGINFTCNPGFVSNEPTQNFVSEATIEAIKSNLESHNEKGDNCKMNASQSRNSTGATRTSESAIVKENNVTQLKIANSESGKEGKITEQTHYDVIPKVQMRDKKTRVHRVQADIHSKSSQRESWLEAEVFDLNKMNVVEQALPCRHSDVFEKSDDMNVDNMPNSIARKDSSRDGENIKGLKQQRKMLKRLLKYQSSRHAEASDDIKHRAEMLIANVRQKESFMLEKLQEQYEATAFDIIGQIESIDAEMASLVKKGGKRNSLVQELIDKESLNDSSEPDDVQSTISEEPLHEIEGVTDSGDTANSNKTPKRRIHKRKSQTKIIQLDDALMKSQKFVPGADEVNFGRVEFSKVSSDMLKKSKYRKERRNAAGSSVSSDPRKSMLIETQLSVCQEGGCKLSWMLDRESRHKGPLWNVEGLAFTATGELVVAEHTVKKGRLQVFDKKGASKSILGEDVVFPWDITVTQSGEYVITSRKTKSIRTVTEDGQMTDEWESEIFTYPSSIAFNKEETLIYITDTETCKVTIHKPDGDLLGKLRAIQDGENMMGHPVAVAVSPDGFVTVLDKTNHCVHLFDSDGIYLYNFGKNGSKDGHLKHPSCLAMDSKGNIYVADSHNNRVSKFSLQGVFIEHVVTEDDAVLDPTYVAVSSSTGQLAVADMLGIKVFNISI